MVATPIVEHEPTRTERAIARAERAQLPATLALVAACAALAPIPFGPLGAASVAVLALTVGRKR